MRYFQLFLLVNTALWTGAQERCSPDVDLSVPLRVVDHGSLNSFLSIARGIAHTVQPEMSKATMDEIYTSLKTKNIDVSKITSMVIEEQKPSLVFTAFGVVIALSSLLFGLVVLIVRHTNGRDKKSSDTSTSIRLLCLLLLTCSFVFILTGVILNSQSSSTLFTSMGNLKTNLGEVFEDISKFSENGKISLICFADNLVNDTLNEVTTNVQTMPKFLTDTFRELIGITIFDQVDVNKIQETITTSRQQCRSISKSIDDLQSSSPSRDCSAKLHALKTIIESLTDQLNNVEDIVSIRNIADTADKDLHRMISDKTKDVVGTVTNKVRSEYNGYRNKVEDDHTITDFLDKVKKGSGDALEQTYSSSVYTATKTLFAPLVSIPGIIALLFILIAATFITISCLGSRSSLSRYSSNFSGSFVMTGFYILIVFAFFVTILSSVEYLGGSFISTACKTLFQDPSLSRLPDFDKVELIPGDIDNVKISLGDVLTHCREDRTLYTATGLNSVLNSNYVLKKLELPSIKDGTAGLVDQAKQEMSKLQKQMKDHENQIKELRKHINDLTDELTPIVSLNECEATDQATTRKILDGVASLKTSILVIRDEVERISTALLSLLSLSPNVIDGKVDEITAKFTDLVEKPVRQGIDTGFNGLATDLLRCRGVYNVYQNLGSLVCEQIGAPYHGIWAATGLCGLCFLATAIIFLLLSHRSASSGAAKGRRR